MLKLATVFSGIGAIEHALDRMKIEHEVVFACDNGDLDIFAKKIDVNIDEIGQELQKLSKSIYSIFADKDHEDLYKMQLNGMLEEAKKEFEALTNYLDEVQFDVEKVEAILDAILDNIELKKIRAREYGKLSKQLLIGSLVNRKFVAMQATVKLINDFKKENSFVNLENGGEFISSDGTEWGNVVNKLYESYRQLEDINGKKIVRKAQDLSQRAGQLHEKITYMNIQKQLEALGDDWDKRKEVVDLLYKDVWKRNKVKQSYLANYKLAERDFHWNVAFLDGKEYAEKVDLFVGGSPCQSFSLVGKQRGLDDTRGTLFYEYARLVDEIRPKVFIYENVRAVTSHDGGKTWSKMQEVFLELGYTFSWKVLNAKNYGIPQNRERLFVVGIRKDLENCENFEFPKEIPLKRVMKDFLIDNAPGGYFLPKKGAEFVTMEKNLSKRFTQIDGEIQLCQKKNQEFNWHGDFVFQSEAEAKEKNIPDLEKYFLSEKVRKYVLSTGTKNFYSKPEIDLEIARPLLTSMHKMHRAGVDNYVTTDGRLRKLTPRECLRLMGFSDEFKIVVSDTAMYQQAGNSIVVDVLIHIMKSILDVIDFS